MKLIFWLCFTAVLWCYAGYPLVQILRARFRPRPLRQGEQASTPPVSVILAARNGAESLRRRVENLFAQDYPADRLEVIVVCNGCSDATEKIATELSRSDPRVRVLVSAEEAGKAGALNLGVAHALGDYIVFADVRQSFSPGTLRALLRPFADPGVGAVSGRLVIQRGEAAAVEGVRLYWGLETALRLAESRTGSVMGVTGAIYAVRQELFQPIPANTILDDVWLPMRLVLGGHRVVLQPDAVAVDCSAADSRHEYLRKRRTMIGNFQLVRLLPALLSPARNPAFIRFASHKLLRLATPLLFLLMLATAGLIPELPYRAFFLLELGGYLLGALGLLLPFPRLSVPAAFVMMHGAILSAFLQFRADAGAVWVPAPNGLARVAVRDGASQPVRVTSEAE